MISMDNLITEVDQFKSTDPYYDRNQLVIAFMLLCNKLGYNVGIKEYDSEWPIIFIDLPTGQISYHVPKEFVDEFSIEIPEYNYEWDGHTLEEKRLNLYTFIQWLYLVN